MYSTMSEEINKPTNQQSSWIMDAKANERRGSWDFPCESVLPVFSGSRVSPNIGGAFDAPKGPFCSPKSVAFAPFRPNEVSFSASKSLFPDSFMTEVVGAPPEELAAKVKECTSVSDETQLPLHWRSPSNSIHSDDYGSYPTSPFSSSEDDVVYNERDDHSVPPPVGSPRQYAAVARFVYAPPRLTKQQQNLQNCYEKRYCERVKRFLESYTGRCRMSLVGEHCPVPKDLPERKKAKQILMASKYDFEFEGLNGNLVVWYRQKRKPLRRISNSPRRSNNSMVNPGQKAKLLQFLERR